LLNEEAKTIEPTEDNNAELKEWFDIIITKLDNIRIPSNSITNNNKELLLELKNFKEEIFSDFSNYFSNFSNDNFNDTFSENSNEKTKENFNSQSSKNSSKVSKFSETSNENKSEKSSEKSVENSNENKSSEKSTFSETSNEKSAENSSEKSNENPSEKTKECSQCGLDYSNCRCPKLVEEKIDRKILFEYAKPNERSPFHETFEEEDTCDCCGNYDCDCCDGGI
jgi:hypothetical protein